MPTPAARSGFVTRALATAVEAGCTEVRILCANSPFYDANVVAACDYDRILACCGSADGALDGRARERLAARLPRLRICWDLRDDIHEAAVP